MIFEHGWVASFVRNLFLRIQISHADITNTSMFLPSAFIMLMRSHMFSMFRYLFLTSAQECSHTSRTCTQSQMAWTSSSFTHPHWSHTEVSTTFLFFKFTFVGSALKQARQVNTFTLLGIFKCQMNFQKLFTPSESELEGSELNSFSHSSWYPVLTKYEPDLHLGHDKQSSWSVTHKGMLLIL